MYSFILVKYYEIHFSETLDAILEQFNHTSALSGPSSPQSSGGRERVSYQIGSDNVGLQFNSLYSIVIRGVDEVGNVGRLSNVARIQTPKAPAPSTTSPEPTTKHGSLVDATIATILDEQSKLTMVETIALISAVCAAFIIFLILVLYFVLLQRKRRKAGESTTTSNLKIDMSPSKPDLLEDGGFNINMVMECDLDEVKKHLDSSIDEVNKLSLPRSEGNSVKSGQISPVQSWTVSQLLSEHERRSSVSSAQTSQLDSYRAVPMYNDQLDNFRSRAMMEPCRTPDYIITDPDPGYTAYRGGYVPDRNYISDVTRDLRQCLPHKYPPPIPPKPSSAPAGAPSISHSGSLTSVHHYNSELYMRKTESIV